MRERESCPSVRPSRVPRAPNWKTKTCKKPQLVYTFLAAEVTNVSAISSKDHKSTSLNIKTSQQWRVSRINVYEPGQAHWMQRLAEE